MPKEDGFAETLKKLLESIENRQVVLNMEMIMKSVVLTLIFGLCAVTTAQAKGPWNTDAEVRRNYRVNEGILEFKKKCRMKGDRPYLRKFRYRRWVRVKCGSQVKTFRFSRPRYDPHYYLRDLTF